ncbi:MAG: hypothetical protein SV760_03660 [Halobacteria archaeon]|nr:hypothetical protein [Halobacteria archaeon]
MDLLDGVGESWRSTLAFVVVVGFVLTLVTYADGSFDASDSALWWMGTLIALVALVTTFVRRSS